MPGWMIAFIHLLLNGNIFSSNQRKLPFRIQAFGGTMVDLQLASEYGAVM